MQEQENTSCPFNVNHVFAKEKLIFHLNRCKDREKVQHMFKKCSYNPMHFIRIEHYATHEMICPDKAASIQLTESVTQTYLKARSERERSLQKCKGEFTVREKMQESSEEDDRDLESCEHCRRLMDIYRIQLESDTKFQKYMRKYEKLEEMGRKMLHK